MLWKRLQYIVEKLEPWGVLLVVIALFINIIQISMEFENRIDERIVRAWTLVTTNAPGNSGKGEALEYLNSKDGWFCNWLWWKGCIVVLKERTSLVGIDLSETRSGKEGTFLFEVKLHFANLSRSDLSGATLFWAELVKSTIVEANLSKVDLSLADLTGTNLSDTNLSNARLWKTKLYDTNLQGVNLTDADISGAHLHLSRGLTQQQIDVACASIDDPPHLPESLTWKDRPCPTSTRKT